jgi:hypothetical protein
MPHLQPPPTKFLIKGLYKIYENLAEQ